VHDCGLCGAPLPIVGGIAVLQGFSHMLELDGVGAAQVGNGACHLEHAVRLTGGPGPARGGLLQALTRLGADRAGGELCGRQRLVAARLSGGRARTSGDAPPLHLGGGFTRWRFQHGVRRLPAHLHMQIDPVEQGAAQAMSVARDLIRCAAAQPVGGAPVPARAWVHRCNQLKACRELGLPRSAREGDDATLQGLAQSLQRVTRKLGQLIQEQHAVMRERNLARPRR